MRKTRRVTVFGGMVGGFVALLWYIKRWHEFEKIPCAAPGLFEMIGLFLRHRGDLGKAVVSLNKSHGYAPLKFQFAGIIRLVVVSSPGMWACSSEGKNDNLEKMPKGQWYYMLNVLFGDNLITLNHKRHKRHRQVMTHFTSKRVLNATLPSLNKHSARLVEEMRKHKSIELEEWMTRVTFDIISDQAFGFKSDCLGSCPEGLAFSSQCRQIAAGVMKHYLHAPGAARLWKWFNRSLYQQVDDRIYSCIAKRRKERAARQSTGDSEPVKPRDLLDLMLDASLRDGGWTDKELRDECFILFLAGHETTAETLTWILAHIASDKGLQTRLRAEVRSVVGGVNHGTLLLFPELTKVCKEALRLYPPAFMITRYAERDVAIDGCKVPKGYDFMLNLIGLQRNPGLYANPEKFDPDRWDDDACGKGGAFAPFALGPRQCLGRRFFWNEAKAILSAVLSNFELETDSIPDWNTVKISTQPSQEIFLRLKPL